MTNREQYVATSDLEQMAGALFNGGMAPLPRDPLKRRDALAAEFSRAHVTIPGVSKRNAATFAKLEAPFRTIADARQSRVDGWLAAMPKRHTLDSVRSSLVACLGEQALKIKLMHTKHAVAACLVLIDRLEGRKTPLTLECLDLMKDCTNLAARLEAVGLKEKIFGNSPVPQMGNCIRLLGDLADAVADARNESAAAGPCGNNCTSPTPAKTAFNRPPSAPARTAPTRPAASPRAEMSIGEFNKLNPEARMSFILSGGKLSD